MFTHSVKNIRTVILGRSTQPQIPSPGFSKAHCLTTNITVGQTHDTCLEYCPTVTTVLQLGLSFVVFVSRHVLSRFSLSVIHYKETDVLEKSQEVIIKLELHRALQIWIKQSPTNVGSIKIPQFESNYLICCIFRGWGMVAIKAKIRDKQTLKHHREGLSSHFAAQEPVCSSGR